jgi:hypothetical protein
LPTPAQSPLETVAATQAEVGGGGDRENGLGGNNADSGSPLGAAIGGAVAGVAAIVAALVAFFIMKKRRQNQDDVRDEDVDPGEATDLGSTVDLGEDHVFVSEYGLSDNRSEGGDGGEGEDDSNGDD